jgi:FkbM family methyltransferase
VKNLVRGLRGTHELSRRLRSLNTASERLSDTSGDSQLERVRELEDLLRQREMELSRAVSLSASNTVMQASEDAFFRAIFNDVEVFLPRDTIRTMVHCMHGSATGPLMIRVEEAHRKWLMARMARGGTFLDVGAATGAMTIPMAATFGSAIQIVAFEPAQRARRLLAFTLSRNGLTSVEIVPKAVSNSVCTATFCEYGFDETGNIPFLPEASAINTRLIDDTRVVKYDVEVTTLDAFCSTRGPLSHPTVIKIDVEGFETLVLEGSSALISSSRPWLAIDIHRDPFGEDTTEAKVRGFLGGYGYSFEKMEHVLLAEPQE